MPIFFCSRIKARHWRISSTLCSYSTKVTGKAQKAILSHHTYKKGTSARKVFDKAHLYMKNRTATYRKNDWIGGSLGTGNMLQMQTEIGRCFLK